MKHGDVYRSNNCGDMVVVSYCGWDNVLVRFVLTGYECRSSSRHVKNGGVKDPLFPNIFGVGFFGVGSYKANVNGKDTRHYKAWHGMMTRCYSEKYHATRPTYVGCSVAKEWHNFQDFADWYCENHPNDGGQYQLDKDIISDGNKVYSADTCKFVSLAENNIKAQAKYYDFTSPDGDKVKIYNMAKFCRDNGLSNVLMGRVNMGRNKSHKGWSKA